MRQSHWKHEWCVPISHCNSGVPRKAEVLSSHRSGSRQFVVTAVPLSIKDPMTQSFVFPTCTSHCTFSLAFTPATLPPPFPSVTLLHVLIHLPGIDLKLRDVTSGKHLSHFKRHCYSFWAILACQTQQAEQKCSTLYTFASDVSDAPAQPS
jgi:hypothetical protein